MLDAKNYNAVLTEAYDYFQNQGLSIIGKGYEEIATNPALFESYVETLTEGASANSAATMAQLMVNTNAGILHESSITGIQPVASLSMPVIRKLWPKFALKEAFDPEVAKSPRFVVSYTRPYLTKGDDEKIYLPKGLKAAGDNVYGNNKATGKKYVEFDDAVEVASGAAVVATCDTAVANTPSAAKKQPCDELVIEKIHYVTTADAEGKDEKIYNTRLSVNGNKIIDLSDGQLIVQFSSTGATTFAYVGAKEAGAKLTITAKVGISSEYNEESYSVGFDIERQDIDIPTGQHINAVLPVEWLQDMMALYQIDGTKETVDLMTNTFAQNLDLEVLDFIETSFANQPNNKAFADHDGMESFSATFDCLPAAGFAGSPKAWREELKPMIDHIATKIKNATYLQNGIFTIVANPLDAQLISNVDWNFRAGASESGVEVDYSVGSYVGANTYKVISSVNVTAGVMYILFTPSSKTQMTYKYYPYTFSTEMGYVDPNRSRVPSIMMTKRHTFYEFLPACGAIIIENNNGSPYNAFVSTKAYTEA